MPRKIIGVRIAEQRKKLGLDQEELAVIIGKTRTSITNMEAGRQNFTLDTLLSLSAALDLTPSELLDGIALKDSVYRKSAELRGDIKTLQNQLRELLND